MQVTNKTIKSNDLLVTVNIRLNTIEIIKNGKQLMVLDVFENDIFEYTRNGNRVFFKKEENHYDITIYDDFGDVTDIEEAEIKIAECVIDQLKSSM